MTYWSAHSHSRYSIKDALPTVEAMVDTAVHLDYPGLGLTDHAGMGGAAALYTSCRSAGIEPLPGVEAYVALDRNKGKRPATMHMGMLATTETGYRNLVGLVNQSHRQFRWKPVLDLMDLAEASTEGRLSGVAALSGCWFGMLPTLLRDGDPLAVRNLLVALDGWFDGFYVELQHHNIVDETHDDPRHVAALHAIAAGLGLPVVLTQDSHYCDKSDRTVHETMKKLVSWSDDPDDAVFPGDGYHMVDQAWMESRFTPAQLSDGLAGLDDLLGRAKVVIPELDHFSLAVPDLGGNPDEMLTDNVAEGLLRRLDAGELPVKHLKRVQARCKVELEIVVGAGFSGYLLLAQDVCDYMRGQDILFNVRGSGSGSELLWALGITSFEPITWGLPFDRFLSTDRTKPPDIDIDVEHRRRPDVIEYIRSKYHVAHISTWMQMGLNEDATGSQKGSLLIRWKQHARKTGMNPDVRVNPTAWATLQALADAKAYSGYGVHPAGLMITPDEATAGAVPLQWVASSKTMVTAFGKDDVERMGLVKLDLLGLKTLTAVKTMCSIVGVELGAVPLADAKTFALMRKGDTVGIFQLEGGASTRGVRQLGPRRMADVIASMALFRPATLDSGATKAYIDRRSGDATIPVRHDWIMEETKDTYGVLLYQEQALNLMKRLGLTVAEMESARKAIKASNEHVHDARKVLTALRTKVATLARANGFSEIDIAWLDEGVDAYAGYGFNKAHATAYGVLAYITAWFRANHPVAFWAGMLDAYAESTQEIWYGKYGLRAPVRQPVAYRLEAEKDGVRILGVHVNRSKESWSAASDGSGIRAGLTSVKNVGTVAARELVANAPYADLADLAMRVSPRRVSGARALGQGHTPLACGGVIAALSHAGALSDLAPGAVLVPVKPPRKSKKSKEGT